MTAPAWHEGYLVAFDVETTGTDVHNDRIVTASVVHLKPGERPRSLSWVINPGVEISTDASDVHGWTQDRIDAYRDHRGRRAYEPAQAMYEIAGQVALAMSQGIPLVAFNASFDLTILEAECARHEVPTLAKRLAPKGVAGVVDPMVLDKKYSRRRGPRKLVNQVQHYGVIVAGAHDAGADALAAARLLPKMVAAYPELARMSLGKLHQSQIGWRQEQCDSLRAYFDRQGTQHDGVCGEWPLHVACARAAVATA